MKIEFKSGMKINNSENNFNNTNATSMFNRSNSCSSGIELNTTSLTSNIKDESTSIPIGIATSSLGNEEVENNLKLFIKTDPDVSLAMLFENQTLLDQYRNAARSLSSQYVS